MDVSWQRLLLFATALVFAVFLLWKYRPTLPLARAGPRSRRPPKLDGDGARIAIMRGREAAREARTPRERASALLSAAEAASQADDGLTSAMGLYLRAMRADATYLDPIRGIAELLRKERPELLETVLWRRLAILSWTGETVPAVKCTADVLAALYRRDLRHRDRARALHKLVSTLP